MSDANSRSEDIKKIAGMIKDIKTAMMSTVDPSGCLRSRPMVTQDVEFDGTLWFFTGASTSKASEIQHDQHVNLAYASPDEKRFVSLCGRAQIVRDPQKAEELWKPAYRAWFPGGVKDPDLVLIKVNVEMAEYWDSSSAPVAMMIHLAKNLATGAPTGKMPDMHKKVDLT